MIFRIAGNSPKSLLFQKTRKLSICMEKINNRYKCQYDTDAAIMEVASQARISTPEWKNRKPAKN